MNPLETGAGPPRLLLLAAPLPSPFLTAPQLWECFYPPPPPVPPLTPRQLWECFYPPLPPVAPVPPPPVRVYHTIKVPAAGVPSEHVFATFEELCAFLGYQVGAACWCYSSWWEEGKGGLLRTTAYPDVCLVDETGRRHALGTSEPPDFDASGAMGPGMVAAPALHPPG